MSQATANREDKLGTLKRTLCWSICHLLAPRAYAGDEDEEDAEDNVGDDDDGIVLDVGGSSNSSSGGDGNGKTKAKGGGGAAAAAIKAFEREKRETQMLHELEKIMQRIREARSEYGKAEAALEGTNAKATEAKRFVCGRCGNRDPELIFTDPRTGDSICRGKEGKNNCGEVVQDHFIHLGEARRNFEDQEDRNHHGPQQDSLMPDSVNMRTSLGAGPQATTGQSKFRKLQQIAMQTEMDLSNLGKEGRAATRTGYKTNHKFKAFRMMSDLAIEHHIHEAVIERAKQEFARYREVKESILQFEGTVVGCIVLSYLELSQDMNLDVKFADHVIMRDLGPSLSYTDALNMTVSKDDVALHAVPDKRINDFAAADVHAWLAAVGGQEYAASAQCIGDFMNKVFSGEEKLSIGFGAWADGTNNNSSSSSSNGNGNGQSKKRKAADAGIFLSSAKAINQRALKNAASAGVAEAVATTAEAKPIPRGNLVLAEHKLSTILAGLTEQSQAKTSRTSAAASAAAVAPKSSAEDHFRAAILRRSRFDMKRKQALEAEEAEARRKRVEAADYSQTVPIHVTALADDDVVVRPAAKKSLVQSESKQGDGSSSSAAAAAAVDVDIDDLFGGAVSTTFAFGKSASAPKQNPPEPTSTSTNTAAAAAADAVDAAPVVKTERVVKVLVS